MGWRDWAALAAAAWELLRARIVFARLSAKALVARLQRGPAGTGAAGPAPEQDLARLARSIGWAAAVVPWRSDCLIQCLTADRLLRRRGLVPEFYIGVQKTDADTLAAHAWIYCQGMPIAGGDGAGFEVLIGPEGGAAPVTPPPAPRSGG